MMHRTVTALAATAILALTALPVVAQQTTPQSAATAQPPATSPNRTATVQMMNQPPAASSADIIAAIGRSRGTAAQLAAMRGLTTNNVRIVRVSTIFAPGNMSALNAAMTRNQSQLAMLRQTLSRTTVTASTDNSTMTIGQFLADNKIDLNRVAAVDLQAGTVIVYVQ